MYPRNPNGPPGRDVPEHLQIAPLPAVPPRQDDYHWEPRIEEMLSVLRDLASDTVVVLKGGTAARLGHGLSRPSQDIDVDTTSPADTWRLLGEAANATDLLAICEPRRRSSLKGILTLVDPRSGTSQRIEVDAWPLRDTTPEELEKITESRARILMYTARELARQKINLVAEPGGRRRARDRYDITWWLHNHIDQIDPEQRIALDRALRADETIAQDWSNDHLRSGIDADDYAVHCALATALDRDPAVLRDRWPRGRLHTDARKRGGADVTWQPTPDSRERLPVAVCRSDVALETLMTRLQVWERHEVPEYLCAIARQRAQSGRER